MNKYLSFIFASVLTLTGVQLSKASNPSDSLAIVSAKWEISRCGLYSSVQEKARTYI